MNPCTERMDVSDQKRATKEHPAIAIIHPKKIKKIKKKEGKKGKVPSELFTELQNRKLPGTKYAQNKAVELQTP